ncbi:DUF4835 family protein [soil metagenome]
MKRLWFICCLLVLTLAVRAQELNCKVQIISQKITTTDPKVLKTLETTIFEFMNNRKWTGDVFKPLERIECSFIINITEDLGSNNYKATANMQVSRIAYNSGYSTPLINYADGNFNFTYVEYQPIEFNENTFNSNLASLLAYYAYVFIGLDYDSYSLKGGTPYFLKAQQIRTNVPQNLPASQGTGWQPTDGLRNRQIMIEDILRPRFEVIREASYEYHRKGLDVMFDNVQAGRAAILAAIQKMERLAESDANAMILQMFFDAKRAELIKMFSKASPGEKANAYNTLVKLDPKKAELYLEMKK